MNLTDLKAKPIDELLPPFDPSIKLALEGFGALIDETVAFGTHVLSWQMKSATGGDEVAPITLSMRHMLEMLAAISACIKSVRKSAPYFD